jgi:hypothetical protein
MGGGVRMPFRRTVLILTTIFLTLSGCTSNSSENQDKTLLEQFSNILNTEVKDIIDCTQVQPDSRINIPGQVKGTGGSMQIDSESRTFPLRYVRKDYCPVYSNGQPIEDKWFTVSFNDQGYKVDEGLIVNGKPEGLWIEWYPNGQEKSSGPFVNGVMDGVFTVWHDNGKIFKTEEWVRGVPQGKWREWNTEGTLAKELVWENGHKTSEFLFTSPEPDIMEFLELIKMPMEPVGGFDPKNAPEYMLVDLMAYISQEGLSISDVNDRINGTFGKKQVLDELSARQGDIFKTFAHLSSIYSVPYDQYSKLTFTKSGDEINVYVSDWYHLVFIQEDLLYISQINYEMLEGD